MELSQQWRNLRDCKCLSSCATVVCFARADGRLQVHLHLDGGASVCVVQFNTALRDDVQDAVRCDDTASRGGGPADLPHKPLQGAGRPIVRELASWAEHKHVSELHEDLGGRLVKARHDDVAFEREVRQQLAEGHGCGVVETTGRLIEDEDLVRSDQLHAHSHAPALAAGDAALALAADAGGGDMRQTQTLHDVLHAIGLLLRGGLGRPHRHREGEDLADGQCRVQGVVLADVADHPGELARRD
mmetsp:Transcript_6353/g.15706  ORF Transcript_6353/g.15706 Transcript_6353/m.15706 type:complete len:244 (+) Transcript_6353:1439-2170(+)